MTKTAVVQSSYIMEIVNARRPAHGPGQIRFARRKAEMTGFPMICRSMKSGAGGKDKSAPERGRRGWRTVDVNHAGGNHLLYFSRPGK
ncbi:MAG: hypothetical protein QM278_01020 [Pseudomonadota bacterium]|nr:hypothetical protein [Pseudomonadota bacterium]